MPELPEVEHLRRSLDPWIVGAHIISLRVDRRGVVQLAPGERRNDEAFERALGVGSTIAATLRHGKQMAIELATGRVFVVQLGMTGSLTLEVEAPARGVESRHRHVRWEILPARSIPTKEHAEPTPSGPSKLTHKHARAGASRSATHTAAGRLVFRDPRRFGGIVAYRSVDALREAWSRLGPDALTIDGAELFGRLQSSRRPVKAALLDQSTLAGVGNIYADEGLHAAQIHPLASAHALGREEVERLAVELRRILGCAVDRGGSTLRDYRDAFGRPGDAVQVHRVYGRAAQPCLSCGTPLLGTTLQARTTVFCPVCQDLSTFQNRESGRSPRPASTPRPEARKPR
ncbi:MAG: bifunctional DNA-formamidopyrimidine glycosylase/DNA-(apurinic or apyrimidinic site) lyase [bacterium]